MRAYRSSSYGPLEVAFAGSALPHSVCPTYALPFSQSSISISIAFVCRNGRWSGTCEGVAAAGFDPVRAEVLEVGGLSEGPAAETARGLLHGARGEGSVVLGIGRQLRGQAVAVCRGPAALLQHRVHAQVQGLVERRYRAGGLSQSSQGDGQGLDGGDLMRMIGVSLCTGMYVWMDVNINLEQNDTL